MKLKQVQTLFTLKENIICFFATDTAQIIEVIEVTALATLRLTILLTGIETILWWG